MAAIEQLKALAQQKLKQRGMEWFFPVMDYIYTRESGWNPQAHNTKGEDSVGLGQMNRAGGMGTGYSVAQLMDPSFNMDLMLDHVQKALAGGTPLQQALQPWSTTHGIDAASLIQGGGNMATPTTTPTATSGPQSGESFLEWVARIYGFRDTEDEAGAYTAVQQAEDFLASQTPTYTASLSDEYRGKGTSEQMTPYEQEDITLRKTGEARQQAADVWDMETWVRDYERDAAEYGDTMALQKFTDKVNAAQEGRTSAEAAVEYESQFAPPGMTHAPYGGVGSVYAETMKKYGYTPAEPFKFQPTSLPRTYEEVMAKFTPEVPQYGAPTATTAPPMPPNMGGGDVGGGVIGGGGVTPVGYQGPSADVIAGAGMQPQVLQSFMPVPQTSTPDPLAFLRALQEVMRRRMQMFA